MGQDESKPGEETVQGAPRTPQGVKRTTKDAKLATQDAKLSGQRSPDSGKPSPLVGKHMKEGVKKSGDVLDNVGTGPGKPELRVSVDTARTCATATVNTDTGRTMDTGKATDTGKIMDTGKIPDTAVPTNEADTAAAAISKRVDAEVNHREQAIMSPGYKQQATDVNVPRPRSATTSGSPSRVLAGSADSQQPGGSSQQAVDNSDRSASINQSGGATTDDVNTGLAGSEPGHNTVMDTTADTRETAPLKGEVTRVSGAEVDINKDDVQEDAETMPSDVGLDIASENIETMSSDQLVSPSVRHSVQKVASREDGGECLYIPGDAQRPPHAHTELSESMLSPDSGIDDGYGRGGSLDRDYSRGGSVDRDFTPGASTPEALSEVFSPDQEIVTLPTTAALPEELLPRKPDKVTKGDHLVTKGDHLVTKGYQVTTGDTQVKFQSSAPTVVTPTRYDDIRDLDIAEDWKESVTVVTKQDHEVYTRLCGTIVDDLVDTLPLTDTNAAEKDVTPDLIPETISAQLNSTYTSEPTDSLDAPVTDSTVTEPAQQLPEPTLIPSEPTSFPTEPTSIPSEPEITVTEPDQPQDAEALLDLIPVKEPKPDSADPVTSGPETVLPETVAPELVPEPKASPVEEAASETAPPEAAPAVEKLIEPTAIQASAAEPVVTEPVVTEPATEPVITEPAAEPVTTESVTAEPEVREPRAAEPVLADPVAAEPEAPEPVLPAAPSETIEEQPLPKGSYTFNWDDIDEFSDPFAPKASKIPTSPKVPTKVATSPKPVDNKPEVKAPSPVKTVAEVSPQVPESVPEPLVPLEGAVGGLRHLDKLREADIANVSLDAENFPEADEPPEDDKLPELTEAELIAPLEAEQSAALEAQLSAARLETSIHEAETSLDAEELPAPATVAEDLPITPQDAPLNKAKMSAGEEEIPISKGAYNIDWDNFDDNINPFATKSKVVNEDQPLNASSNAQVDFEDPNFDPFKPKAAMANSPTLSRKPGTPSTVTKSKPKTAAAKKTSPQPSPAKPAQEPADINQNVEVKSPPSEVLDNAATDNCEPREGGPHDLNQRDLQDTDRQSPKKKQPGSATKKAPRRFKPPARFAKKQGDEDEIQILAGPPPPRVTEPASEPAPELSQPEPSPKAPSQPSPEAPSPAAEPSQPAATQPPAASEPPTQQPPVTADPPREAREAPPLSHSSPDAVRGDLPTIPQEFDVADEEFAASDPNMFNDPAAWDMLEKFGTGNNADFKESALARQSLYVKFDPLVKGQSPVKALRKPSGETIAESEDSLLLMGTPPPTKGRGGPRHPASRALEAQISARDPPTRPDSLGHTPPHTPGEEGRAAEVDRLFACSPATAEASGRQNGTSPVNQRDGLTQSTDSLDIVHVLKYSQADLNRIKKELDLDYQARFLAKERDWEKERDALDKSHGKRDQELKELRKQNVDMKSVVSEYEQTMTQLIELDMIKLPRTVQSEKESYTSLSKESLADLVKERDQALEDLHSVETAFSDLHRRFEKSKAALEGFKKNEETFKKALSDQQTKIKKQDDKYQALKKHAEEKLEQANTETERIRKATQADLTRLQAGMKRADLQIQSLEQQIEQKVKENKELTSICDELINKVEH